MNHYMDARRFLSSVKTASKTKKAVGMGLVVFGLVAAFAGAACMGTSEDTDSSSDNLDNLPNHGLPYTMHNYYK